MRTTQEILTEYKTTVVEATALKAKQEYPAGIDGESTVRRDERNLSLKLSRIELLEWILCA